MPRLSNKTKETLRTGLVWGGSMLAIALAGNAVIDLNINALKEKCLEATTLDEKTCEKKAYEHLSHYIR